MIRRLIGIGLCATTICFLASACTTEGAALPPVTSSNLAPRTLSDAKSIALGVASRIAHRVPSQLIASNHHLEMAHLLSCASEGDNYSWPGETTLVLHKNVDVLTLMNKIAQSWTKTPGFTATLSHEFEETPSVAISADDGGQYFVDVWHDGAEIKIESFSPCFALPDGNNGGEY